MAPIPVYTNSPIIAAKPDGVTPKTVSRADASHTATKAPSPTSTYTPTAYPAAQPGAAPSLPTATSAEINSPLQPTPTASLASASPAPPQPGSVPVSGVPPPPKTGERYQPPPAQTTAAPTMPYPHQMAIPAPAASHSLQRGTSTATVASSSPYMTQLPSATTGPRRGDDVKSLSHPAGYQQNANASELDRYQRSAMEQRELDDDGEGIWGAAKKLAQQTGERLAAVENEVWKKINKE